MTQKSFSVRIFLQDGHVDGVKIIGKSKWPGRALVIPRSALAEEIDRKELSACGVYALVGPSAAGDFQTLYISAADLLCDDLRDHDAKKEFWNWVIVFASKDDSLSMSHARYFESRLIRLAQETKRANLDNLNDPPLPELSVTELADAESFLAHVLSICPLLGLPVFEKLREDNQDESKRGLL